MTSAEPAAPSASAMARAPLPLSMLFAWQQWFQGLAASPSRQARLIEQGARNWMRLASAAITPAGHDATGGAAPAASNDQRFTGPAWQQWPFNLLSQGYSLQQAWWAEATRDLPGLSRRAQRMVDFSTRQMLDAMSPANHPATNPVVQATTFAELGGNLVRGAAYLADDIHRLRSRAPAAGADAYRVGKDVACTPGKVVHRNRLAELIQYTPATETVFAEPILIVPAWIMKYYILDLSPENSLVNWLVGKGHTVFIVSWLNPDERDRDLALDDYRVLGIEQSLRAIEAIVPDRPVHAAGYCLGGTLLAIAAAAMARDDGRDRLASLTLLAAQTDFEQPGDLDLFIDEPQLRWLEAMMARTGFLDSRQMAVAFSMLRSGELVWSRLVREYLLGRRTPMIDLMAWNADGTRMPERMHSEYLRSLYLRNDLAHGRLLADGRPVSLADVRTPIFALATVADPVAPWQSVFRLHDLTRAEITFVLTTGGHNAGVVNPPGTRSAPSPRFYQAGMRAAGDASPPADPKRWRETAPSKAGSWWTPWQAWLAARSSSRVEPPVPGSSDFDYGNAPGWYVRNS